MLQRNGNGATKIDKRKLPRGLGAFDAADRNAIEALAHHRDYQPKPGQPTEHPPGSALKVAVLTLCYAAGEQMHIISSRGCLLDASGVA